MQALPKNLFPLLGCTTNGDFADVTLYKSRRGRLVIFLKTWPKDPATYHQTVHRNRWRHAGIRWRALPQSVRDDWLRISKRANLNVTGYNIFMYYILNKNIHTIETLEHQTGINVIAATGDPLPYYA